jgi:hypothetical protein
VEVEGGVSAEQSMTNIYIYQIYYDEDSRAALDPGFIPLDNTSNERPDWFEYHPIRKFLLEHKLEDDAYYGFFSPRFGGKTKLNADRVKNFIRENAGIDVALFCPLFDQSALFQNVFWQGEAHHPGLIDISQGFANDVGIDVDIKNLVTDSTNTIFSNYFVAKSVFWAKWFHIAEQLYNQAEGSQSDKTTNLAASTSYRDTNVIHMKVFLMERLATLILSASDIFTIAAYKATELPMHPLNTSYARYALVCDALKLAYRRLKNERYLDEFFAVLSAVAQERKSRQSINQNQNLPRLK